MVLVRYLPTDAPYILGHVVDRGCDTPVEYFVVHSPNIGQVGSSYEGRQALFLIVTPVNRLLTCHEHHVYVLMHIIKSVDQFP